MPNLHALNVVQAAVSLGRSHPHAPPLDVLDLVMRGREGQMLNFIEVGVRHASLADPSSPFGQLVAAALDRGMEPEDWISLTSDRADAHLRERLLDLWRDEVMESTFAKRYGVTIQGLP
jgi:hypothetical protein